ncbi:glycosyl hydrolase family 43 protein [Venturia nashicola]|uniref:Glycosyl hydrolase family 43 protein n=1 Tax=Venturia nashicola TaxID=86259 RepID=A0A4Z1PIW7_9PEZI|nr:glycosyl hydrolase family 43 protein [Venturia nashicola]TLD35102.1 glycosyl hydrolase family 43 protein [Venturia nashicola]
MWKRVAFLATLFNAVAADIAASEPTSFHSPGNPILYDGTYFSADPAPFVYKDNLYILCGRDEAPASVNDFIMNEWQVLQTSDPAKGDWKHYPAIAKPNEVFKWAAKARAYASQIVPGKNGKFYMYSPVFQAHSRDKDPFAIGVAISDTPVGPWKDLHPAGPILSQSVPPPGNTIQNIDPTVLIDTDGKIYIYYGTFGQLRAYELEADMITPKASTLKTISLPGFFEAPWLMKRKGTYYLLYAANNAGPTSPCTPTSYHACQAYATASSPLGPWTYRGVFLDIVSSTTSHSGAVEFKGQWYLAYHTADAIGSNHFRRSVALDKLEFDDSSSPPKIKKVVQTHRPKPAAPPTRNIATKAVAKSEGKVPIQYWIKAVNDGIVRENPLPPDMWSSYNGDASPASATLILTWPAKVTISGTAMAFFADQPAGSSVGVAPPREWHLEYLDATGAWVKIAAKYGTQVSDKPEEIKFAKEITTKSVKAVLVASGGGKKAGLGVKEWFVYAPTATTA